MPEALDDGDSTEVVRMFDGFGVIPTLLGARFSEIPAACQYLLSAAVAVLLGTTGNVSQLEERLPARVREDQRPAFSHELANSRRDQPARQMTPAPKVACDARLGDEVLHKADLKPQNRLKHFFRKGNCSFLTDTIPNIQDQTAPERASTDVGISPASFSQMNSFFLRILSCNMIFMLLSWLRLPLLFCITGAVTFSRGEPLTSIESIRGLDAEARLKQPETRLQAVVTFYHKDWGVLFVHDGHSGICVGVPETSRPARPFVRGAKLHIEGVVMPGEFLPVVLPSLIREEGAGAEPEFRRVTPEELFQPALDAHPVEVLAIVKGTSFMDESLVVELQVEGWPVKALVPQSETVSRVPWQLLERRVRVQGVAGTHFNDQRQMSGRLLFVPGLESIHIEEEPHEEASVPVVPVDGLLRVDSPLRQRIKVCGVVTHLMPGRGLYLRGEGGSLFVQTAQPIELDRGDEVCAEGYPVVTPFRPSLSALDVQKSGETQPPAPVKFHAAKTRDSREQCELVTLDADFVEMTRSREATSLLCRSDGELFEALLPSPEMPAEELAAGMKLRLTGICELITTRPLVIPRNATGFRIHLRAPQDIVVLARQPWWNERRALWVLGALAALALTAAVWAMALKRMVSSQSAVIRAQAQQQATLEERQRIARDLHDTLEQELVGVTMLLDNTAMRLNGTHPQASEPLGMARRLLRRAREESRSTIRELRSVALEQRGLSAAMEELLRPLATAGGADFNVEVAGVPVRMAGTLETNLLRIAHEAVANAALHAQAGKIKLSLHYLDDAVRLEITDDGHGFDFDSASTQPGHFGLSGMKERVDKIGGTLDVRSTPGHGTSIAVHAPAVFFQPAVPTT